MQVGVLGINHKSAPLSLREQVAQVCDGYYQPDQVILSTCNRTEIYFSHTNLAEVQSQLFSQLKKRLNHSSEHAFYSFFGSECFYHLACVTAGLDSALLAESDIQRQVKLFYKQACHQVSLDPALHYLFQKSLKLSKDARSRFPLFHSAIHLEGMIYNLVDTLLCPHPVLLLIGNSDINRKIIHYFSRRKKGKITLVTRNLREAYPFAMDYGVTLKSRDEISAASHYDGIISATTTEEYLITSLPVQSRTRLIIDLSVPRSINPCFAYHPALTLFNMQQIGELSAKAHILRSGEIEQVKTFLESSSEAYTERFQRKRLLTDSKDLYPLSRA